MLKKQQICSLQFSNLTAAFLMTLPITAIFFCVQRYFLRGVTLTGMKG